MSKAVYEVIDDEQPYYGEVPDLKGVWAAGKTSEECRENLKMAIEDWMALSLRFDLAHTADRMEAKRSRILRPAPMIIISPSSLHHRPFSL